MRESASTDLREPQGSNPLGPPGPELVSPELGSSPPEPPRTSPGRESSPAQSSRLLWEREVPLIRLEVGSGSTLHEEPPAGVRIWAAQAA